MEAQNGSSQASPQHYAANMATEPTSSASTEPLGQAAAATTPQQPPGLVQARATSVYIDAEDGDMGDVSFDLSISPTDTARARSGSAKRGPAVGTQEDGVVTCARRR